MPMYVEGNPKSKKAVKDMIAAGKKVYLYNPGLGGEPPRDGYVGEICGPHSPKPHSWYGTGVMKDGCLISIK